MRRQSGIGIVEETVKNRSNRNSLKESQSRDFQEPETRSNLAMIAAECVLLPFQGVQYHKITLHFNTPPLAVFFLCINKLTLPQNNFQFSRNPRRRVLVHLPQTLLSEIKILKGCKGCMQYKRYNDKKKTSSLDRY
jgi:hypothetical protein